MLKPLISVLLSIIVLFCAVDRPAAADELVERLRAERQVNHKSRIDVTYLVSSQISIGISAKAAVEILKRNGFKFSERELPDGSRRVLATRREESGMPFFLDDEYRVVLTIEDGRVTDLLARIVLQAF
jgi:hypothetical protein